MKESNTNNYIKYLYDKDEMTVKFYKNYDWSFNFQPFDSFLSPFYVSSAFVFKFDNINNKNETISKKIDIDRFLNALDQTFEPFNFLLSTFKNDENGKSIACYKPNNEEFKRDLLEIEYNEEKNIDDVTIYSILPDKIVNSVVKNNCLLDLTDQGLFFLKLTILKEGFAIGYCFNHCFLDQSSIFYFFKYLSNCYTYGNCNGLKEPYLADSLKFLNENLKFNNLEESTKFKDNNFGYGCFTENKFRDSDIRNVSNSINQYLTDNTVIHIIFNVKNLNQFKGNHSISKNDIITSCLLKILTFTPLLNDDEIFDLKYICNYRKFLNYDESAIGNFALTKSHKFTIKDIRSMSVLELSLFNRSLISKIDGNDFKNAITWLKFNQNKKYNVLNYLDYLSFYDTTINNWSSFNYETIQFDNSKLKSLLTPKEFASFGSNTISFDNFATNNIEEIKLTMDVSVPNDSITKIIEFSKFTNLFNIKQNIKNK